MCKLLLMLVGLCLVGQSYAYPCYITVVKDTCWLKYNVSVDAVDVSNGTLLTTLTMPKGTSWARQKIDCQGKQVVMFKSTYSPVFWEGDEGKLYAAKRYWSFPEKIEPGEAALNMRVCFSTDFAEVSLPPDASGHCGCDMTSIPEIKSVKESVN